MASGSAPRRQDQTALCLDDGLVEDVEFLPFQAPAYLILDLEPAQAALIERKVVDRNLAFPVGLDVVHRLSARRKS